MAAGRRRSACPSGVSLIRIALCIASFFPPDGGAPRYNLGIEGSFKTSGNDGTIMRFGWKAQNQSLLIFASEAYNVEQGVTNEGFPMSATPLPDACSMPRRRIPATF